MWSGFESRGGLTANNPLLFCVSERTENTSWSYFLVLRPQWHSAELERQSGTVYFRNHLNTSLVTHCTCYWYISVCEIKLFDCSEYLHPHVHILDYAWVLLFSKMRAVQRAHFAVFCLCGLWIFSSWPRGTSSATSGEKCQYAGQIFQEDASESRDWDTLLRVPSRGHLLADSHLPSEGCHLHLAFHARLVRVRCTILSRRWKWLTPVSPRKCVESGWHVWQKCIISIEVEQRVFFWVLSVLDNTERIYTKWLSNL